jgi:hypothetical protein
VRHFAVAGEANLEFSMRKPDLKKKKIPKAKYSVVKSKDFVGVRLLVRFFQFTEWEI